MEHTDWSIIWYISSALTRRLRLFVQYLIFLLCRKVYQLMMKQSGDDGSERKESTKSGMKAWAASSFSQVKGKCSDFRNSMARSAVFLQAKETFSVFGNSTARSPVALIEPTGFSTSARWQLSSTTKQHFYGDSCDPKQDSGATGYIGLRNEGNTCYLNALLQCLYFTPEFSQRFFTKVVNYRTFTAVKNIFLCLNNHLEVTTRDLRHCLLLEGSEQQDVPEIFQLLLNKLDEEPSGGPSFKEIYESTLVSLMECQTCGGKDGYQTGCNIVILPLAVSSSCSPMEPWSVDKAMAQFQSTKEMTEEDKVYCDVCEDKTDTKLTQTFTRLPPVLVVQLKRFDYSFRMNRYEKLNDEIVIGSTLEVKCEINKQPEVMSYELFAICDHHGGSWGGHYTALIKPKDHDKWYYFNDRRVETVLLQQKSEGSHHKTSDHDDHDLSSQLNTMDADILNLRSRTAYLLMYRQKSVSTQEGNEGGAIHADPSPPKPSGASVRGCDQWGSQDVAHEEHRRQSDNENLPECHGRIFDKEMPLSITDMGDKRTSPAGRSQKSVTHTNLGIVSHQMITGPIEIIEDFANPYHRKASSTRSSDSIKPETSEEYQPSKYQDTALNQEHILSPLWTPGVSHSKTHQRLLPHISQDSISSQDLMSVSILEIKEEHEIGDSKQIPQSVSARECINWRSNKIIPVDTTRVSMQKFPLPIKVPVTICREYFSRTLPMSSQVSITDRHLKKASPNRFPELGETICYIADTDHRITPPQKFKECMNSDISIAYYPKKYQDRVSLEDESILSPLHLSESYHPQRSQERITPEYLQGRFQYNSNSESPKIYIPRDCCRASSKELHEECINQRATQIITYGDTRRLSSHKNAGPIPTPWNITPTYPRRVSPQIFQGYCKPQNFQKTSSMKSQEKYIAHTRTQYHLDRQRILPQKIPHNSRDQLLCVLPTCLHQQCLHGGIEHYTNSHSHQMKSCRSKESCISKDPRQYH